MHIIRLLGYIYTIDILISKEADTTVNPTDIEISFDHDKNADDGLTLTIPENYDVEENPLTLNLVATVTNRNNWKYEYDGAITWEIIGANGEESSETEVISLDVDENTGVATVTAVGKGTAAVKVALGDDSSVYATLGITVTDAYITGIGFDYPGYITYDADDDITVIVTMSDGWEYTGTYTWEADSGNTTTHMTVTCVGCGAAIHLKGDSIVATWKEIWVLTLDDGSTCTLTFGFDENCTDISTIEVHLSWED